MLRLPATVLALALVASLAAAQPAPAQEQQGGDGLSRLWRTYPLEQTTTVVRGASSQRETDAGERAPPPVEAPPSSAFGSIGLLVGITLVVLGLAGGALRLVRGGRIRLNRP